MHLKDHLVDDRRIQAVAVISGAGTSRYLSVLGLDSWAEASGFVVTVYTLFLIADWLWKKWKEWRK